MSTHIARALGASLLTLWGCQPAASQPSPPKLDAAQACPTFDDTRQARALLQHYCVGCHSPSGDAGDEHDFTQPELVRAQRRSVSARLRAQSMPPRTSPQPTAVERALLQRWSDCGAR